MFGGRTSALQESSHRARMPTYPKADVHAYGPFIKCKPGANSLIASGTA